LEGVFGVVDVAEDAPAHAQHHRPMMPNQSLEGGLIAMPDKPFEQRAIALTAMAEHRGEAAKRLNQPAFLHAVSFSEPADHYSSLAANGEFVPLFSQVALYLPARPQSSAEVHSRSCGSNSLVVSRDAKRGTSAAERARPRTGALRCARSS